MKSQIVYLVPSSVMADHNIGTKYSDLFSSYNRHCRFAWLWQFIKQSKSTMPVVSDKIRQLFYPSWDNNPYADSMDYKLEVSGTK